MTKSRAPKIGAFQAVAAALGLLALLLAAVSLLRADRQPTGAGQATELEARASGDANAAEAIKVGLNIRKLGPVDATAETFSAGFDLWLVGRELPDPAKLVFLDAVSPIQLGEPVSTRTLDGRHYRLYRAEGSFRYRPTAADLIAGRLRLDLTLVDAASSASQILFVPDREGSNLVPTGDGQNPQGRDPKDVDGGWTIQRATLNGGRVALPTLGDPLFPAALESHPQLVASFFLLRSSPGIGELAQRLVPGALAIPLLLGMLGLLAVLPLLGRLDRRPGPWRMFATLGALTLLPAAAGKVFADHLALGLGPEDVRTTLAVLAFGWLALIAAWLIGLLPTALWRPLERRTGAPLSALERMAVNVVIVLAFLLYFLADTLDLSAAAIGAASGVLTIVLGLALQNIILDVFAGVLLNLEKPFRLLNWVTVVSPNAEGEPVHGQVRDMNWRTTQLQTRDNDIVSVPNSVVAGAVVVNHAAPSSASRFKLEFVLDPQTRTQRARQVMREAVLGSVEAGLVLEQPPPSVVIMGADDGGIRYRVMFYLNLNIASDSQALNSVAENVLDALAAARIELAFRSGSLIPGQGQEEVAPQGPGPAPPPLAPGVVRLRPDATAVPDPKAVLGRDDIARIRESWARVAPLGERMAILFYDRLFEAAPSLKSLFRSDTRTQRTKLVAMLAMLVKALDRPEILLETLADLGLRHHTYGVQPGDYDAVAEALLWTLEQGLGDAFDPPTREAWTRLYGVIAGTMIRASGRAVA